MKLSVCLNKQANTYDLNTVFFVTYSMTHSISHCDAYSAKTRKYCSSHILGLDPHIVSEDENMWYLTNSLPRFV